MPTAARSRLASSLQCGTVRPTGRSLSVDRRARRLVDPPSELPLPRGTDELHVQAKRLERVAARPDQGIVAWGSIDQNADLDTTYALMTSERYLDLQT